MKISELPYNRDSEKLFSFVVNEPWSIFLDSGYPRIDTGRYDIITAQSYIPIAISGRSIVCFALSTIFSNLRLRSYEK